MPTPEENPGLDRVHHELRTDGVRDVRSSPLRSGIHTRGYLPHVKREGASYFITYRLADSLPKAVLLRLEQRRAEQLRAVLHTAGSTPPSDRARAAEDEINREFRREIERYLDAGRGACHLRRPEIASVVAESLRYFDRQRYVLHGWVVMPNHVHVVAWPMPNRTLSQILKTWKQYTARRAMALLGIEGDRFWQPEAYDHWVRSDEEKSRILCYIRNNPVKAGLCARPEDWRWGSAWQEPSRLPPTS